MTSDTNTTELAQLLLRKVASKLGALLSVVCSRLLVKPSPAHVVTTANAGIVLVRSRREARGIAWATRGEGHDGAKIIGGMPISRLQKGGLDGSAFFRFSSFSNSRLWQGPKSKPSRNNVASIWMRHSPPASSLRAFHNQREWIPE